MDGDGGPSGIGTANDQHGLERDPAPEKDRGAMGGGTCPVAAGFVGGAGHVAEYEHVLRVSSVLRLERAVARMSRHEQKSRPRRGACNIRQP